MRELFKPEVVRMLSRTYYAVQKERIQASNRIKALIRLGEDPARVQEVHAFLDERLKSIEKRIERYIVEQLREAPIWMEYLVNVKGIGPVLAGALISEVYGRSEDGDLRGIERFDTVSALWKYAGQHTVDGHAPRRERGKKVNWNPWLRTICWKISEQFVKTGDRGFYGQLYQKLKPIETKKHGGKACNERCSPKLHIHMRTKRKVVKIFLANLWDVWRRLEGLPVGLPYAHSVLGHTELLRDPAYPWE